MARAQAARISVEAALQHALMAKEGGEGPGHGRGPHAGWGRAGAWGFKAGARQGMPCLCGCLPFAGRGPVTLLGCAYRFAEPLFAPWLGYSPISCGEAGRGSWRLLGPVLTTVGYATPWPRMLEASQSLHASGKPEELCKTTCGRTSIPRPPP